MEPHIGTVCPKTSTLNLPLKASSNSSTCSTSGGSTSNASEDGISTRNPDATAPVPVPVIEDTEISPTECCFCEWFQWLLQCFSPQPPHSQQSPQSPHSPQSPQSPHSPQSIFNTIKNHIEGHPNKNDMENVCRDFYRLGSCSTINVGDQLIYTPPGQEKPDSSSSGFIDGFFRAYQRWHHESQTLCPQMNDASNTLHEQLVPIAINNPLIARIMRACWQATTGIWYPPIAEIFMTNPSIFVAMDRNSKDKKWYEISFGPDTIDISHTQPFSLIKAADDPENPNDTFTVQFKITLEKSSGEVTSTRASIIKSPEDPENDNQLNAFLLANNYTWPDNYL